MAGSIQHSETGAFAATRGAQKRSPVAQQSMTPFADLLAITEADILPSNSREIDSGSDEDSSFMPEGADGSEYQAATGGEDYDHAGDTDDTMRDDIGASVSVVERPAPVERPDTTASRNADASSNIADGEADSATTQDTVSGEDIPTEQSETEAPATESPAETSETQSEASIEAPVIESDATDLASTAADQTSENVPATGSTQTKTTQAQSPTGAPLNPAQTSASAETGGKQASESDDAVVLEVVVDDAGDGSGLEEANQTTEQPADTSDPTAVEQAADDLGTQLDEAALDLSTDSSEQSTPIDGADTTADAGAEIDNTAQADADYAAEFSIETDAAREERVANQNAIRTDVTLRPTAQQIVAPVVANTNASSGTAPVQGSNGSASGTQPIQSAPSSNGGNSGSGVGLGGQQNARAQERAAATANAGRTSFSSILETRQQETIRQVAKAIGLRNASAQHGRVSLLLHPEQLGRLELNLKFEGEGNLSVEARADNAAARHLLAGQTEELRNALREHNIELSRFSVDYQGSNASSSGGEASAEQSRRGFRGEVSGNAKVENETEPRGEEQSGPLRIGSVNLTA